MQRDQWFIVWVTAAILIVAAGTYLIVSHGSRILDAPRTAMKRGIPKAPVAQPATAQPRGQDKERLLATEPAPDHKPGTVYKCPGTPPVYSDTPCVDGKIVDTRGSSAIVLPKSRQYVAGAATSAEVRSAPDRSAAAEAARERDRRRQCEYVLKAIEQIDAQARAGGSASYQDDLRVRRAKLVDRRYELRC